MSSRVVSSNKKKYDEVDHDTMSICEPESYFGLEEFELYKAARELRKRVYKVIKSLPNEEKYALGLQMRKAIISVTNNIADSHGRWHYQETISRLFRDRIARGSIEEIIDDLNICIDEGYSPTEICERLKKEGYKLVKQINSYIHYLKKSQKENTTKGRSADR